VLGVYVNGIRWLWIKVGGWNLGTITTSADFHIGGKRDSRREVIKYWLMAHYRKKSCKNQFGIMSGSDELHKLIRDNLRCIYPHDGWYTVGQNLQ